ncbi:MAG TPA: xanthine dehydrogenase family protein subunit M [Bryobacteraceae bacterium]|nr:xanthine dehydrogenase family protein subunit M [Bryobacteraceae bacterium]
MFEHVEAFYRPATIREALRLLRAGNGEARIVAGGTDVIVDADRSIRFLIDITNAGLTYIRRDKGTYRIGATTTMAEIEDSPKLRSMANGLLNQAAATCGSVQNRNLATIGGNLAHGSPAADTVTALLALDALVVIASERGQREVPIADYLAGPHKGLLTEITIPAPPAGKRTGWSFQKLGRTAIDVALVNVAAGFQLDARSRVKWAKIALGSAAPTPVRAVQAEQILTGRLLDTNAIGEAAEAVTKSINPITDVRATSAYRRQMSSVLTARALHECAAQAGVSK